VGGFGRNGGLYRKGTQMHWPEIGDAGPLPYGIHDARPMTARSLRHEQHRACSRSPPREQRKTQVEPLWPARVSTSCYARGTATRIECTLLRIAVILAVLWGLTFACPVGAAWFTRSIACLSAARKNLEVIVSGLLFISYPF
jgi:hypothetical protein